MLDNPPDYLRVIAVLGCLPDILRAAMVGPAGFEPTTKPL